MKEAAEFDVVYTIPAFGDQVVKPEESGKVGPWLRMVVEDDWYNAAARGEDFARPSVRLVVPRAALKRSGIDVLKPGKLQETELAPHLSRLLIALSNLGVYLEGTDHLSDRELYEVIDGDILKTKVFAVALPHYGVTFRLKATADAVTHRDRTLPKVERWRMGVQAAPAS